MINASVTISLVPQAKGGPFIYWDELKGSIAQAAEMGFHGVEIFPPDAAAVQQADLPRLLDRHGLQLAAMGTGAGWLLHRLHLCHPDAARREQARQFIAGIVDVAGSLGAPAIIGSMQGRCEPGVTREQALGWLAEALTSLGERAAGHGMPLLYEPLNRYETDLLNQLVQARDFLQRLHLSNLRLLADLFHMNIEEVSIPDAITQVVSQLGHVHWADSNRRAAGFGHLDLGPIALALGQGGYHGFVSAEALPYPDSRTAAGQTMRTFRGLFGAAAG